MRCHSKHCSGALQVFFFLPPFLEMQIELSYLVSDGSLSMSSTTTTSFDDYGCTNPKQQRFDVEDSSSDFNNSDVFLD